MEDRENGRQRKWKITENERQRKWKVDKMEGRQNGR